MRSIDTSIRPGSKSHALSDARPVPADLNPVTPADLAAIDGTAPAPGTANIPAPSPGLAPDLPDPEGPRATPRQIEAILPQSVATDAEGLPMNTLCMAWMAFQALTECARQAWRQQGNIKRLNESWRNIVKAHTIEATIDKIAGDRGRGKVNFGGSVFGTLLAAGVGYQGAMLSLSQRPFNLAAGASLSGITGSVANTVQSATQAVDKTWGFARQSDDAEIEQRFLQRDEDLAQQIIEWSRGVYDTMKQQLQRAQQSIVEMNERRQQALNALQR